MRSAAKHLASLSQVRTVPAIAFAYRPCKVVMPMCHTRSDAGVWPDKNAWWLQTHGTQHEMVCVEAQRFTAQLSRALADFEEVMPLSEHRCHCTHGQASGASSPACHGLQWQRLLN